MHTKFPHNVVSMKIGMAVSISIEYISNALTYAYAICPGLVELKADCNKGYVKVKQVRQGDDNVDM